MMTLNGTASAIHSPTASQSGLLALSLGSLGVVYGDIGTSPLYAFREAITSAGGSADGVDPGAVLSVLSLILWALILIVTVKYVLVLLRADNNGEGGTLTLMALAQRAIGGNAPVIFLLGVISAALFYGDAVITPAISVLSAIEGLKLATPTIEPYIVLITLVILFALFLAQSKGTAKVSTLFGPIMTVWFLAIALPGFYYIAVNPGILAAVNPVYGINFLLSHGKVAFITLGAVFLAVTGAEALYADLGHFGRRPVQLAWVAVVLLVGLFRSSDTLAGAYGIAVSGTMVVTAMMAFIVIWRGWGWPLAGACALIAPFLIIDVSFFFANSMKIFDGGWMPLALALLVILVMYTWRTGSQLLFDKTRKQELPLAQLVKMLEAKPPQRVPGTAVFLTSDPQSAPTALLHSLKHYKVLHEKNVILTVRAEDTPR